MVGFDRGIGGSDWRNRSGLRVDWAGIRLQRRVRCGIIDTMGADQMSITVLHKLNSKGQSYRKTLQYGYDPQQGIDRWMGMRFNGLDPWVSSQQSKDETYLELYACGLLRPNYTLPAVIKHS